jgi:predicted RNA-binding Zn-ribbon protein involved in translation (DUF1610 family)
MLVVDQKEKKRQANKADYEKHKDERLTKKSISRRKHQNCRMCGQPIPPRSHRRNFCCEECAEKYRKITEPFKPGKRSLGLNLKKDSKGQERVSGATKLRNQIEFWKQKTKKQKMRYIEEINSRYGLLQQQKSIFVAMHYIYVCLDCGHKMTLWTSASLKTCTICGTGNVIRQKDLREHLTI